jgi:hypothetical protein
MAAKKAAPKKAAPSSGASAKAKKAQSARMTAQAKAPAKAAKAKTDAARFKKIEGITRGVPYGDTNRFATREDIKKNPHMGTKGMAWEKNATSKNTTVLKGIGQILKSKDNDIYRDNKGKLMVRGKYKGAGSK